MEEQYRLDDKYKNGVWYDQTSGNFCEIQEAETLVELVNPENGNVYWDMPTEVWVEEERHDFQQVSEETVDDPVAVVRRALRMQSRNYVNELASIPTQEAIDLWYARERVTIEVDE